MTLLTLTKGQNSSQVMHLLICKYLILIITNLPPECSRNRYSVIIMEGSSNHLQGIHGCSTTNL